MDAYVLFEGHVVKKLHSMSTSQSQDSVGLPHTDRQTCLGKLVVDKQRRNVVVIGVAAQKIKRAERRAKWKAKWSPW